MAENVSKIRQEGEHVTIDVKPSSGWASSLRSGAQSGLGEMISLGSWTLFPVVVMGASYIIAPLVGVIGFREPLQWGVWPDLTVWPMLFGQVLTLGAWQYYNISYVRDPATTVHQLRDEVAMSIYMGFIMTAIGFFLAGKGLVYPWYILPAVVQFLDAKQSPHEAINNAAQKMRFDETKKS